MSLTQLLTILLEDRYWPEARDHRGPQKLSITGSSKPASDCFRGA
ncbi:hypothetical protein [Comamonas sp. CMM02]|nr:hypothetical protein [Comamonas sp. CMM02]